MQYQWWMNEYGALAEWKWQGKIKVERNLYRCHNLIPTSLWLNLGPNSQTSAPIHLSHCTATVTTSKSVTGIAILWEVWLPVDRQSPLYKNYLSHLHDIISFIIHPWQASDHYAGFPHGNIFNLFSVNSCTHSHGQLASLRFCTSFCVSRAIPCWVTFRHRASSI